MMKTKSIIALCGILCIFMIFITNAFGSDDINYGLLLSFELSRDVIYQYEPLQAKVILENKGISPVKVLPLKIGSIKSSAKARASLILELVYPNGKELKTILIEPYYGPIDEVDFISVEETTLIPGEKIETSFYLSASWGWYKEEKELLFSMPGEYILKFKYCPFTKDSSNKKIKDCEKTINSNEVRLSVLKLSENDEECWNQIKSNKLWWLVYDPEGKNLQDVPEDEINSVINTFDLFLKECPLSIFHPYLQYTEIMAKTKKAKISEEKKGDEVSGKKVSLNDEEITILKELADNEKFSYRQDAEKLLMESVE